MVSRLALLLPAATTNSMPAVLASSMAFSSACEKPVPPQLFDSTRRLDALPSTAFACTANSIARIPLATVPEPVESRNRSPIMLVVQLTPLTPAPLLPTAPMVPETCVPWSFWSIGLHVFVIAS